MAYSLGVDQHFCTKFGTVMENINEIRNQAEIRNHLGQAVSILLYVDQTVCTKASDTQMVQFALTWAVTASFGSMGGVYQGLGLKPGFHYPS